MFSIDYQYREHFKLTKTSKEYLNSTEHDIEAWYHSFQAENSLKSLAKGYDPEDNKLTGAELGRKYQGDTLGQKAISFSNLKLEQQKDILFTSITGKDTKISKQIRDAPNNILTKHRVKLFLESLDSINKKEEWFESSCDFKTFARLPLEEKEKYHNALVKFHDEEMKKQKHPPKPIDQFTASSPGSDQGGCPDFNDSRKWDKI